jgi:hypothetical protein
VQSHPTMKKRINKDQKTPSKRRLGLKKELLRNLSATDLGLIAGGIGCPVSGTHPPDGSKCC